MIDITEEAVSRHSAIGSLLATGTKPSFLLWDKVYQKLTDIEDERWSLRANEAVLRFYDAQLSRKTQIWLVFQSPSPFWIIRAAY